MTNCYNTFVHVVLFLVYLNFFITQHFLFVYLLFSTFYISTYPNLEFLIINCIGIANLKFLVKLRLNTQLGYICSAIYVLILFFRLDMYT